MSIKKSNLVTIAFLIYLAAMAAIGWPSYAKAGNYIEYFSFLGASIVVIVLLRVVLRRREKLRQENKNRKDASDRRCYRDDQIL